MATIKYIVKGTKDIVSIYIRLIDGVGTDVMAKTNYVIHRDDWSASKQQPKNLKDIHNKELNVNLSNLKLHLLRYFNEVKDDTVINTQWLKNFINPKQEALEVPSSLLAYFDFYIESKRKMVSANSIKKYNVIKANLKRYEEEHKTTVLIKDVNPVFQASWEKYCIKQGYAYNTITMQTRFFQTICRHAAKNGIEISPKLESIENKYESIDTIYLTPEDLEKIKATTDLSPYLENARDWLLISCYTGQRVSDFLRFEKSMIRKEKNREGKTITLIEFTQTKTNKKMTLPLHKEVLDILEKREGEFPHQISDVKYNKYIKKVCKKAGLTYKIKGSLKVETKKGSKIYRKQVGEFEKWELVSSHIGRRSFATNFYGKIPTSLLIAATGHSTEALFLSYIGKSSSDRAKELAEYFN